MNFIDVFLGICLGWGAFKGIRNGFFVELASLVSMLLGIFIAIKFSHLTKNFLESHGFAGHRWIETLAFIVTFLAVMIGVSMLARLFTSVADFANLGWVNQLFGALFGLLKTLLMVSILLNLLQKINVDHVLVAQQTLEDSKLYAPTREVAQLIYPAIEDWFTAFRSSGYQMKD